MSALLVKFPKALDILIVAMIFGFVSLVVFEVRDFIRRTAWRPGMGPILIVAVCGVGLFCGLGMMFFQYREYKRTMAPLEGPPKDSGELTTVFDPSSGSGFVAIQFETTSFIGPASAFVGPQAVHNPVMNLIFARMAAQQFIIERDRAGRLLVSTKVRDRHGRLVGEIVKNEWKTAPSPIVWDRNYTRNALEIRDETGRIVLQVVLTADRVKLQGIWRDEDGQATAVVGDSIIFAEPFPDISPMFVYPSNTHFGELIEDNDRN